MTIMRRMLIFLALGLCSAFAIVIVIEIMRPGPSAKARVQQVVSNSMIRLAARPTGRPYAHGSMRSNAWDDYDSLLKLVGTSASDHASELLGIYQELHQRGCVSEAWGMEQLSKALRGFKIGKSSVYDIDHHLLELMRAVSFSTGALRDDPDWAASIRGRIIRPFERVFKAIEKGALCSDGRRSVDHDVPLYGMERETTTWSAALPYLQRIAIVHAALSGRGQEAADLLRYGLQHAVDHINDPSFYFQERGYLAVRTLLDGVLLVMVTTEPNLLEKGLTTARFLITERFSVTTCRRLAEDLRRMVSSSTDLSYSASYLALVWGRVYLGKDAMKGSVSVCAVVDRFSSLAMRLVRSDDGSWLELADLIEKIDSPLDGSPPNYFAVLAEPSWYNGASLRHTAHALLAAAELFLLESANEVRGVADPFGTRLLSGEYEGRRAHWSVGANGVDDGGDATWDLVFSKFR
jgi:hypothetical protein